MARRVLKERVFAPSGNMLGTFRSIDLETFDIEYEESDEPSEGGGQVGDTQKNSSSVPQPKDDNPLKPEDNRDNEDSEDNSNKGGSGANDNEKDEEQDDDEPYTGEIDPYGNDIDDEEPLTPDIGNEDSGSSGGSAGDSIESLGDTEDDDNNDTEGDIEGNDISDVEGGTGDDGSDGTEGDTGDGGDAGNNDTEGDISDAEDENTSSNSKGSKPRDGDKDGDVGDGDGGDGDADYDDIDWDPMDEGDGGWKNTDLQKALEELEDGETDVEKDMRKAEDDRETTKGNNANREENPNEREKDSISRDEARAIKDALGKAIKDAEESKKKMKDENTELEDSILSAIGAGNITTLFNPRAASDWRRNLERVLDGALGFNIVTNPNLINKKIEDAPPGREDELPEIRNIIILLDCSGSMGAKKFLQVIEHLDTMMRVRNMSKTNFHIIDWGDTYVQSVSKTYIKVKGVQFKREIIKHAEHGWGTNIIPAFLVASQKCPKPDAIIIMTDGEIFDGDRMGSTAEGKIAEQYVKKFRKKIIWALTYDGSVKGVGDFDPTAKAMGRIIKFKKS